MNTPIINFVRQYANDNMTRLHMPGHKGRHFLGCELYDITEISGADALYEANGIIAQSEANAAMLFETGQTVYSTEGSSQCIRAMLYLVIQEWKKKTKTGERPIVIAARNVHKAFVYAGALLDFDVRWLWPRESSSICGCPITAEQLEKVLQEYKEHDIVPAAVYITSPDYVGGQQDVAALAQICHKYDTILAVDNAHGAYLHFTEPKRHPIDLGADICCDSAHKTLPVLTGGAYLHIHRQAPEGFIKNVKNAMALFGSTSPSYLILSSLDLCNRYLALEYKEQLEKTIEKVKQVQTSLFDNGWRCEGEEPIKLTVCMPNGLTGVQMADVLRHHNIECEFADDESIVLMFTPENKEEDYQRVISAFGENSFSYKEGCKNVWKASGDQVISIREAVMAEQEEVLVTEAEGRICASPTVSCPPAIPIVISGEVIDEKAIELFQRYGISKVRVVKTNHV